jgi:hypothetical protein
MRTKFDIYIFLVLYCLRTELKYLGNILGSVKIVWTQVMWYNVTANYVNQAYKEPLFK